MAPEWLSVRIIAPSGSRQAVSEALFEAGAGCVFEDGPALVSSFPPGTKREPIAELIAGRAQGCVVDFSDVPEIDWSERWKAGVGAHRLGALTVAPPWIGEGLDPAATVIIDPAMAFGTGEHASTRGAVRLLEGIVHDGARAADLGAGSGVLAIAMAKLGAASVAAIENDPQAIGNLEANIARNGVAGIVQAIEGDAAVLLPLVAPLSLITANIISSVILELLPAIGAALVPHGDAVIAGILLEERDMMRTKLADAGWRVRSEDIEGAWWSARISR